jgi:hypothetical protein
MKRLITILAVLTLAITGASNARGAVGSSFGNLTTGRSLDKRKGMAQLGVGIGLGDDQRNSVAGGLSYGLFEYTEARLRLGLADADKERVTVGGDFKYQFMDAGPTLRDPFDLSTGLFFEYIEDVFQVGAQVVGSRSFLLGRMQILEPYARFNVRMEHFNSDSHIEFGLNPGVRWGITPNISLFGEFQFDGNEAFFIGLQDSVF